MRGDDRQQGAMYSYISPEARVPHDHPLRAIRGLDLARDRDRVEAVVRRRGVPASPVDHRLDGIGRGQDRAGPRPDHTGLEARAPVQAKAAAGRVPLSSRPSSSIARAPW
jgi:hypothetical protein